MSKLCCVVFRSEITSDKHEEILSNLVDGFEKTKDMFAKKVEDELSGRPKYFVFFFSFYYQGMATYSAKPSGIKEVSRNVLKGLLSVFFGGKPGYLFHFCQRSTGKT